MMTEALVRSLLLELTSRDILRRADSKSRRRSKKLSSKFVGMKGNIVTFRTGSGTTPGVHWVQRVQLRALLKQLSKVRSGKITLRKAIQAATSADVNVHCNCPAFKYWGWAYIASEKGYKFGPKQRIAPDIRNPTRRGSVCKHLINVLQAMPFNVPRIVRFARKAV